MLMFLLPDDTPCDFDALDEAVRAKLVEKLVRVFRADLASHEHHERRREAAKALGISQAKVKATELKKWQTQHPEDAAALRKRLRVEQSASIREGRFGQRTAGPGKKPVDPLTRTMNQIALTQIQEQLKVDGLKLPQGRGTVTVQVNGSTHKLTRAELIERWKQGVDDNGQPHSMMLERLARQRMAQEAREAGTPAPSLAARLGLG